MLLVLMAKKDKFILSNIGMEQNTKPYPGIILNPSIWVLGLLFIFLLQACTDAKNPYKKSWERDFAKMGEWKGQDA